MPETPGPTAPVEIDRLAVGFTRLVRGLGVDAPSPLLLAEALGAVGLERRERFYWAARACVVHRPEDIPLFDRAFAAFFEGAGAAGSPPAEPQELVLLLDGADDDAGAPSGPGDDAGDRPALSVRWSPREVLRHRDFATYTPAEHEEARRLMGDLRLAGALRRSRRLRATRSRTGRPDLRRTVRRAMAVGGEPIRRSFLEPSRRPRRVVLLCDVSGSMEPYTRALLRFLHVSVAARRGVEAFVMGTRLTRITRELATRDPDAALTAAARRVVDWSGGTRLGDCLRSFNDRFGARGLARGAVVVILSDGWDRGDPDLLGAEMARLRRVAHRIVWVNPLRATPGFAPLARGMAAALPHVHDLVDGHSLASLESLAALVAGRVP